MKQDLHQYSSMQVDAGVYLCNIRAEMGVHLHVGLCVCRGHRATSEKLH